MNRIRARRLAGSRSRALFLSTVFAVLLAPASSLAAPAKGCTWTTVGAGIADDPVFTGVAALSTTDVWAVGEQGAQTLATVAEHWDGVAWSVVPTVDPGARTNVLNDVAGVSSNDVWAVGYQQEPSGALRTLIEHWDGTSWAVTPSPNVGEDTNYLRGVTVVGADNAWAVGAAFGGGSLIEHWDGATWSVVRIRHVRHDRVLNDVVAVSANDIWAVGEYRPDGVNRALVLHWDGTSWGLSPSPLVSTWAAAVAARGPNDAWVVGSNTSTHGIFTEHWDGTSWTLVADTQDGNELRGVAMRGHHDVTSVGYSTEMSRTVAHHWNGSAWEAQTVPNVYVWDVTAVPGSDELWAVGAGSKMLRYCGP